MKRKDSFKLAIFDLDGTLMNTISDLACSCNYILESLGYPTHEEKAYLRMVGNGIPKLIEGALPEEERTEENVLKVTDLFLPYYKSHSCDLSAPYQGTLEVLETLAQRGYKLAVASNKFQGGVDEVVGHFFDNIPFTIALGAREGVEKKPDPQIVFDAMAAANIHDKGQVIYIGDSDVDMMTAHNAEVVACGVTWGYRTEEELNEFKPAYMVHERTDLLDILP